MGSVDRDAVAMCAYADAHMSDYDYDNGWLSTETITVLLTIAMINVLQRRR